MPAARSVDELDAALDELEYRPGYDVEGELARAVEIEHEAVALGAVAVTLRAQLSQADMWNRKGDTARAARTLWLVNRWATEHDHRPLLSRSHWLIAIVYRNLGDAASCLEHAVSAVELLAADAPPRTRAMCLIRLGDALGWSGSIADARARYAAADELLAGLGDVPQRLHVLNNLAYSEYEAGEPELAWAAAERLRELAEVHGHPLEGSHLDTVARVELALGRYADAERTSQASLDDYRARGYEEADSLAEFLLTLAETQRRQDRLRPAQDSLDRCRAVCEERGLAEIGVRVHQEQAELYAAEGRYQEAFALYKTFHVAAEALNSAQREAQARTRQAMFETAEARQEAERFREQALRDPLTGLRNRRYVDERLPALLRRAAEDGTPFSLAVVDLDHFKRVNDTLSHDVGDRVLVTVGGLLGAALRDTAPAGADEAGFVARLGGEEFLLAMPGASAAQARGRCEQVRLAVRAHSWAPITGALPVTVSIGLATGAEGATQAELLADADRNLYAAKHAGRDRVEPDGRRRYRDQPAAGAPRRNRSSSVS
jgi:diguanylate cyclase (GGDEF)-like protein